MRRALALSVLILACTSAPPSPSPAPAPASSAASSAAVPPALGPIFAKLHIDTVPADARVLEDGYEVCASTPCEVTYSGERVDAGIAHALTVSKTGYTGVARTVKLTDSPLQLTLTPLPIASATPRRPAPSKKGIRDPSLGDYPTPPY